MLSSLTSISCSVETTANSPQSLLSGMNKFLEQLKVTFRRDPNNFRPRINKMNSIKDCEQKLSGKTVLRFLHSCFRELLLPRGLSLALDSKVWGRAKTKPEGSGVSRRILIL